MPSSPWNVVVQQLRAAGRDGPGRTGGELLTRFLSRRDADALAALVERHAPMVWGVCRRLLRDPHDAEDAFQATFLVLVQKAATVVPRERVANWLYGVARQTAVRLRARAAKRGRREVQMNEAPEPAVAEARDEELLALLDQELSRLPERFRALIVMCDLEGHTRKEAARQLGCPEGTVASGLARARELLAKRLTQRGVVTSGSMAVLSAGSASASAPPALVASTITVASLLAARQATDIVAAEVAALVDGVVKAMFVTKIKSVLAVVLVAGLALGGIGVGVGLLLNLAAMVQAETPKEAPMKKEPPGGVKPSEAVDERLVGTWTVKFENGVNEWCRVGKDRTAKVVEQQRRSPGKVEVRDGAVFIVYDDDRLERWTPAGQGAVVEHWFPASAYPKAKPFKGVAERTPEVEKPLHFVEKPDMKPQFAWLPHKVEGDVTEESIYVASKGFIADICLPGKIRFRDFIDPRYLKKHGLTDRDIAYEILDHGGLNSYQVADDLRTILFQVSSKGGGKELIVVRWVVYEGRLYISPEKAPDPKTGIIKPWILRTKVK